MVTCQTLEGALRTAESIRHSPWWVPKTETPFYNPLFLCPPPSLLHTLMDRVSGLATQN
uniref:Uncharacterized protein n=1 Tax=Anguilla anguilla TaxID=7936 RepID=A0A0E9P9Z3_ANGAN